MNLTNLWQQEPVAICGAIRLVVLAGMAFGLQVTIPQLVASMAALEAVLSLFTRQSVHTQASVDAQLSALSSLNQKAGV
jgi:hypothetical protein